MSNSDSDPEVMRYGMLGDDTMSEAEKLAKYTGDTDWNYLKPHFKAGSILWVDPQLNLQTVGQAFTHDDKEAVAAWKKSGDLVVPSEPHANHWEETNPKFQAVVVQPFVLIQPVPEADS